MSEEHAYLSIVQWPGGWAEADIVEALAAAAGIDPATGRLIARRGLPAVIARVDALVAPDIVGEFRRRTVMAFAPTRAQLASLPDPHRVKRLQLDGAGSMRCELWRGEPRMVALADIFLILRASVKATSTSFDSGASARGSMMAAGWMAAGPVGAAVAGSLGGGSVKSVRVKVTEMLDLVLASGERYRCNGDKFSFDILGSLRGYSDRENMDKLADLFRRVAPRAVYDADFPAFSSPADIRDVKITGSGRRSSDAPAFDFYAAWAFLLYRGMLRGS